MSKAAILYRFSNHKTAYALWIMAYLSFAFVSSYDAFAAVDLPIPGLVVFIALLALAMFLLIRDKSLSVPLVPSFLIMLRTVLFAFSVALNDIAITEWLYEFGLTLLCIVLMSIMYSYRSVNFIELRIMLGVFAIITSLQIIVSILLGNAAKGAITSGIGDSNYAATFLVMIFAFFLFSAKKWYEWGIAIISLASVFATQSFGAMVAVVLIVCWKIYKSLNWKRLKAWMVLFTIILCIIAGYYIVGMTEFGKPIIEKIQDKIALFLEGNWEHLGSSRLSLYEFSWNNIKEHILFGSVNNYSSSILETDPLFRWQNMRTHNLVFESLIKFGLVGTAINVVLITYLIRIYRKNGKNNIYKRAIFIALVGGVIHGLVEPNFFTMHFELFVWTMIGAFLSPTAKRENCFGGARSCRKR